MYNRYTGYLQLTACCFFEKIKRWDESRTKIAMYYVYVIQSTLTLEIYVGYTSKLKKRLVQHNTQKSFSTKNKGVWRLVYYAAYRNKEDAMTREKRLKNYGQALSRLKERLNNCLLLANYVREGVK